MSENLKDQEVLKRILALSSDIKRYLDLAPTPENGFNQSEPGTKPERLWNNQQLVSKRPFNMSKVGEKI
ncbi:MAG: hypothetical protein ACYCVD_10355 [Desulfitobacteriaceae bacterium]